MAQFESADDYLHFARSVTVVSRHILEEKSRRFLDVLLETAKERSGVVEAGSVFWRAQRGCDMRMNEQIGESFPVPFASERMMPPADRATEGRVNPKGIPCLYLADDRDTAMGEVRPGVGSYVSVAQFEVLRKVEVVDFSLDGKPRIFFGSVDLTKFEKQVWAWVNWAFSEPLPRTDDLADNNLADYVPTQVIAEAFRMSGYDGIAFKSSLGEGKNLALFNPVDARPINCTLFQTKSVAFDFHQFGNTYYTTAV